MKKFDLNIEKILENWETSHAIRELIANALDEQLLTKTKEVEIFKSGNSWLIRDFGRGVQYTHLTQNENQEKLKNTSVIGKFGIGLKDALATFDRKKIKVVLKGRNLLNNFMMLLNKRIMKIKAN
jgi:sugar-specific transcriptional regulator TrmB